MKINSNETSFALLKSIIEEDIDAYKVLSTIIFQDSRVFKETRAHENSTRHRKSEWIERAYSIFAGFGVAYALINRSYVSFVL